MFLDIISGAQGLAKAMAPKGCSHGIKNLEINKISASGEINYSSLGGFMQATSQVGMLDLLAKNIREFEIVLLDPGPLEAMIIRLACQISKLPIL